MRLCIKCKTEKADADYYGNPRSGIMNTCKECVKSYQLSRHHRLRDDPEYKQKVAARARKHRYGLSESEYETMLESQNGACEICGSNRKLHVDHDHETGVVRSLLCPRCNQFVGYIETSEPYVLRKTLEYCQIKMTP